MEWYFYLNYYIYRFYRKYKGESPVFRAFFTTLVLIALNLMTLLIIYQFLIDFWTIPHLSEYYKIEVVILYVILGIINYSLLYRKKKYIEVFDEFQRNRELYKKWDKSVKLYIILSVVIMLLVLIIADLRNHNFELYFLK